MSSRYKKVSQDWFKPSSSKDSLSQAYGKTIKMPEFAIIAENGQQIGKWMKCKDYIQDVIWGSKTKRDYTIYGWKYKHGVDPLPSENWLILGMRFEGKEIKLPWMIRNLKGTIECLEKKLGIPRMMRTKFSRVLDDKFFIWGSKYWLRSIPLCSFFVFLCRASLNNVGHELNTIGETSPVKKDIYYFKNGGSFLSVLDSNPDELGISDWEKCATVGQVHGNGFVSASNRLRKQNETS